MAQEAWWGRPARAGEDGNAEPEGSASGWETGGEGGPGRGKAGGGPGLEAQVITALEAQAGRVPEWVRLLPLGEVPLGDDREPLWVDEAALAAMVAHFEERGLDLVVDYEHQTLSGRKAPAAGWIKELEARADGLWARLEWTETARRHLAAREYRYFSPVLRLEDKTRRPLALLHAALTNTPALNGLEPLVAKQRSRPQPAAGRQGEDFGGAEGQVPQRSRQQAADRRHGETPEGGPGDRQDESQKLAADLAVLLGMAEDAGASRVRGAVLALKANLEQLRGVQEELAALKEDLAARLVQEEVDAAVLAGKITPVQRESALRYARQDLDGFREFVKNMTPQIPLGRLNLGPEPREKRQPHGGLSPQQLLICQKLGLSPEAFKAQEHRLKHENLL